MLAIGAVIGAGIFGSIGTAAAGEIREGVVIRYGAGPAPSNPAAAQTPDKAAESCCSAARTLRVARAHAELSRDSWFVAEEPAELPRRAREAIGRNRVRVAGFGAGADLRPDGGTRGILNTSFGDSFNPGVIQIHFGAARLGPKR